MEQRLEEWRRGSYREKKRRKRGVGDFDLFVPGVNQDRVKNSKQVNWVDERDGGGSVRR